MIPIFTSHYSFGKSILTLEHPSNTKENGPVSIFSILEKEGIDQAFVLDNCLTGFPQAIKNAEDLGIQLIFGIQLPFEGGHKINIFAKDSKGCKLINQIYSFVFSQEEAHCTEGIIERYWDESSLLLAIPFYDSFLHHNLTQFDACTPNFLDFKPTFFLQNNNLPFDFLISEAVKKYSSKNKLETQEVKSILYENKKDVEALQTYKCICSRKFGKSSLSKPNLDHFGSNEFCFEAYKELT